MIPPCEVDPGTDTPIPGRTSCWLPELGLIGNRALVKRNRIIRLSGVLGRSGASKAVGVTAIEAEIMETIETELEMIRPNG